MTTTITTTFTMERDVAKDMCQHFLEAWLIVCASDPGLQGFRDRGIWALTPKGYWVLNRYITQNGISADHLIPALEAHQPTIRLIILDRSEEDDEMLTHLAQLNTLFRRFAGAQPPTYTSQTTWRSASEFAAATADKLHTLPPSHPDPSRGVHLVQLIDQRAKYPGPETTPTTTTGGPSAAKEQSRYVIPHAFSACAAIRWVLDYTSVTAQDEAIELLAHFERLDLIQLVILKPRLSRAVGSGDRDDPTAGEPDTVFVRGPDVGGMITEGEFYYHPKSVYAVTGRGKQVARWEGKVARAPTATLTGNTAAAAAASAAATSTGTGGDAGLGAGLATGPASGSGSGPAPGSGLGSSSGTGSGSGSSHAAPRPPGVSLSTALDGLHTRSSVEDDSTSLRSTGSRPPASDASSRMGSGSRPGSLSADGASGVAPGVQPPSYVPYTAPRERDPNEFGQNNALLKDQHGSHARLRIILQHPGLVSLFGDYLRRQYCQENLSFYLDVQDLKRRFSTTSSASAVRPPPPSSDHIKLADGRSPPFRMLPRWKAYGKGFLPSSLSPHPPHTDLHPGLAAGQQSPHPSNSSSSSSSGNPRANSSSSLSPTSPGAGAEPGPGEDITTLPPWELHHLDLIVIALVIFSTYLAPGAPAELNLAHNVRSKLLSYMQQTAPQALEDYTNPTDGPGASSTSPHLPETLSPRMPNTLPGNSSTSSISSSSSSSHHRGGAAGTGTGASKGGSADFVSRLLGRDDLGVPHASPSGESSRGEGSGMKAVPQLSLEERKKLVLKKLGTGRVLVYASQLQTLLRLYTKIQDHVLHLMATDSVPRFVRDPSFINAVQREAHDQLGELEGVPPEVFEWVKVDGG